MPKKPSPHHSFLLFLLFLLSTNTTADDAAVILKLANSLSPLPSGWSKTSSSNFCQWQGIHCDSSKTKVTSISLSNQQLSGSLPSELSTLSDLQSISVSFNQLSGPIPSFANIEKLEEIHLDSNGFTSMPSGFFKELGALQTFSIGSNPKLWPWELPSDIKDCSSLRTFTANEANIVGSIPDVFDSLPSLQNFRLSYNNLTGPLPKSMAKSGIQNLWINNQDMGLSGTLGVLSSMTSLSQVWVHMNKFTGPVPDLSKCESIYDLQLRDNQLTGVVPDSVMSLPKLANVSLTNNKLQGPVPKFASGVKVIDDHNNYCAAPGVPCDKQVNTMLKVAEGLGYPLSLADQWTGNNVCKGWSFVTCDAHGNVATVNFAKQKFTGLISPAFGDLTSLTNLYLSNNDLYGPIPDSLTKLPQLKVLDVSNNDLSGKVPTFPSTVEFITKPGNFKLGQKVDYRNSTSSSGDDGSADGTASGSKKLSGGAIAGIVVLIGVLILLMILTFLFLEKKKRRGTFRSKEKQESGQNSAPIEAFSPINPGIQNRNLMDDARAAVSIEILKEVTNNFGESNIIGKGGFGVVYKGELHDGTRIAVKRMQSSSLGTKGLNEFQAEVAVLTEVRHRHLVAMLGYCVNGNERLLVYEYMPQGTLGQHLFGWRDHGYSPLTWKQRVTIALDVARGVEYLHTLAQHSFIHRDLKPSNILLTDDMRAKVSDFGLVKNAPDGKHSMETQLAGTFGYLAPEYVTTGRVTTKADVYAYGVILMEIITGKKALDESEPDECAQLVQWFHRIPQEHISGAIDHTINADEETFNNIKKVAELARYCTARKPSKRPDMGHVVSILAPLVDQWKPANQEDDEGFGFDLHMSLSQAIERWQAEGSFRTFGYGSSPPNSSSPLDSFTGTSGNTFASSERHR